MVERCAYRSGVGQQCWENAVIARFCPAHFDADRAEQTALDDARSWRVRQYHEG